MVRAHLLWRASRALPLALSVALAACASAPSAPPTALPSRSAVRPAVAIVSPTPRLVASASVAPETVDLWQELRGSFAIADCEADPAVQVWARRFTRNPERFESKLRAVLPRLVYVQQIAAQYQVPGEFALLPWVESHFEPVRGRRGRPAGMWQIMPRTAGAMGLRVDGHYDGRLDVPAAAHAVMKLLRGYHDQFDDWRVADYAYNSGEFATARLLDKHGSPPATPLIPALPVRAVTRQHLVKLLAIACVVREPERFGVTLPTLSREQHLVQVPINHSMPMSLAADQAGMSVEALKTLNAAFRGSVVDAGVTSYLLLPAKHARQFRAATSDDGDAREAAHVAETSASPAPERVADAVSRPIGLRTHTVRSGDNLWQIARHYSVDISALLRWNKLEKNALQPGQVLKVSAN